MNIKRELEYIYQTFLTNEKILLMKNISMHRGSNCYIHSFKVAKIAVKRALRHKKANPITVLIAAILHDYYLYDWRVDTDKMGSHITKHPYVAAENAIRDFGVYKPIKDAIETHMWPFNFSDFPKTTEARIISLADKHIFIKEILCSAAYKKKREAKYYQQISKLFDDE